MTPLEHIDAFHANTTMPPEQALLWRALRAAVKQEMQAGADMSAELSECCGCRYDVVEGRRIVQCDRHAKLQNEVGQLRDAARAVNATTYSHIDGRDLLAELHPRHTLDIKRRVDARETWFEGDWLSNLYEAMKKLRQALADPPRGGDEETQDEKIARFVKEIRQHLSDDEIRAAQRSAREVINEAALYVRRAAPNPAHDDELDADWGEALKGKRVRAEDSIPRAKVEAVYDALQNDGGEGAAKDMLDALLVRR